MSSLFNDNNCSGNSDTSKSNDSKCKGCVCSVLRQLGIKSLNNVCTPPGNQQFLLVNKGAMAALDLTGSTSPTVFTFQKFDPTDCCLFFTYEVPSSSGTATETYITDCRALAGVSSVTITT